MKNLNTYRKYWNSLFVVRCPLIGWKQWMRVGLVLMVLTTLNVQRSTLQAQSIGIGTADFTPNASSLLEIQSNSNLGLLIPRVTSAQKTAMNPLPAAAQGLMVYQTDGTEGWYYNTSTTTTPSWLRVTTSQDDWTWIGNAGTSPGTDFLGTTDAVDLVFKTNNTEELRIKTDGKVGMGTSAPATKLELVGTVNLSTEFNVFRINGDTVLAVGNTDASGDAYSVKVGVSAGNKNTSTVGSADVVYIGKDAGGTDNGGIYGVNVAIGAGSGSDDISSHAGRVLIGSFAGDSQTSGKDMAIGTNASRYGTTGSNYVIGLDALRKNVNRQSIFHRWRQRILCFHCR